MPVKLIIYIVLSMSLANGFAQNPQALSNAEPITFTVANVKLAPTLLKTDSAKKLFENKTGYKVLFCPPQHAKQVYVNAFNNVLIQTLQECYDNHRPLVLTPDVIWLAICQGVSIHMNEKFDSLKTIVFKSTEVIDLTVRQDSLQYNASSWQALVDGLANKTKEHTKDDFYDFFVADFSTTTPINTTVYQITLLESLKKGFTYIGESGCGIPSITIKGTKQDWETILKRLELLPKIGMDNWAQQLKPVIQEFINVYDHKIDNAFWNDIYKNAHEYNAFYISGWIIKLFPYIKYLKSTGTYYEARDATRATEYYKPNPYIDGNLYYESALSTDHFGTGIAKINVTWMNHFTGKKKNMLVFGGFMAMKQYPDKSLEPLITWVICDQQKKAAIRPTKINNDIVAPHQPDYWSPHEAKQPLSKPVYNIKEMKTYNVSLQYITTLLQEKIKNHPSFKNQNFTNLKLSFMVYSNGKIDKCSLGKNGNSQLHNFIKQELQNLSEPWFPALVHPYDHQMMVIDPDPKVAKLKVRANYTMHLVLFKQ